MQRLASDAWRIVRGAEGVSSGSCVAAKDVVGEEMSGDVELLEPLCLQVCKALLHRKGASQSGPVWTLCLAWSSETGFSKSAGLRP